MVELLQVLQIQKVTLNIIFENLNSMPFFAHQSLFDSTIFRNSWQTEPNIRRAIELLVKLVPVSFIRSVKRSRNKLFFSLRGFLVMFDLSQLDRLIWVSLKSWWVNLTFVAVQPERTNTGYWAARLVKSGRAQSPLYLITTSISKSKLSNTSFCSFCV